jgi:uncharacterized protein YjbI with pentapeptide repeats
MYNTGKHKGGGMVGFKSIIAVLLLMAINIGCVRQHHVDILKSGVEKWNKWRGENPSVTPDLEKADLMGGYLKGANLDSAYLAKANLAGAALVEADLKGANLNLAYLAKANLAGANLVEADLRGAKLNGAIFEGADLHGVNLQNTKLYGAILEGTDLRNANLQGADLFGAILAKADLRGANLQGTDLSTAKSFCKTKLDPKILSQIKENWPELLATVWDEEKKDWVIDYSLLVQIKKPDWHGWPEEKKVRVNSF